MNVAKHPFNVTIITRLLTYVRITLYQQKGKGSHLKTKQQNKFFMSNKLEIIPSLWFDNNAEEAIDFYCSVFPNSKITQLSRYGAGAPFPEGTLLSATFCLNGYNFMVLNGGPAFKFNEAVSLVVLCDTQEEIDGYWNRLIADGGEPGQCGWLKDKYGLSWQIVPRQLSTLIADKNAKKAGRVVQALMGMNKLNISELQAAFEGNQAGAQL